MKKILKAVLIFSFIMVFTSVGYGLSISEIGMNTPITLSTSSVVTMNEKLPDTIFYSWVKNSFSKSYIAILKFPTVPGEKYTLYIKYPIDGEGRMFTFTGSDPSKSKGVGTSFQGVDKERISYYKCNMLTHRFNIAISSKSNSPLYIVYATSKPKIMATFLLKHPKEPDALVEKRSPYPGCAPNVKQFWGSVWKDPLLLVMAKDMPENQKDTKFTGTWKESASSSLLKIKKLGDTYYISSPYIKGVGLLYNGNLIGTFVFKDNSSVGNFKISLTENGLVFYAFSSNCIKKWKKVYKKR